MCEIVRLSIFFLIYFLCSFVELSTLNKVTDSSLAKLQIGTIVKVNSPFVKYPMDCSFPFDFLEKDNSIVINFFACSICLFSI